MQKCAGASRGAGAEGPQPRRIRTGGRRKGEETERDAVVVRGRETGEEMRVVLVKKTIKNHNQRIFHWTIYYLY